MTGFQAPILSVELAEQYSTDLVARETVFSLDVAPQDPCRYRTRVDTRNDRIPGSYSIRRARRAVQYRFSGARNSFQFGCGSTRSVSVPNSCRYQKWQDSRLLFYRCVRRAEIHGSPVSVPNSCRSDPHISKFLLFAFRNFCKYQTFRFAHTTISVI
jgi:hypothetical protein